MVHEKYIKRGGRTYGPYYYESYRENGKVKKRYVAPHEVKNDSGFGRVIPILFVVLILSGLSLIFFSLFGDITGRVTSEIQTDYNFGEEISGTLNFNLEAGELIPADSLVQITLGNFSGNYILSNLVDQGTISGNYYASGKSLVGGGPGFGLIGEKELKPVVDFELEVIRGEKKETGNGRGSSSDSPGNSGNTPAAENSNAGGNGNGQDGSSEESSDEESESDSPGNSGNTPSADNSNAGENPDSSEESESSDSDSEESSEESESESDSSSDSEDSSPGNSGNSNAGGNGNGNSGGNGKGITGNVIAENRKNVEILSGSVSKGEVYEEEIGIGGSARVVSGSVKSGENNLSNSDISLAVDSEGILKVETSYVEYEKGFGREYRGSDELALDIDLGQFGIIAEAGQIEIKLIKDEQELAVTREIIDIEGKDAPVVNDTEVVVSNLSLIQEIEMIRISKNRSVAIDLSNYFSGALEYKFNVSNISSVFEGDILHLSPDAEFKGSKQAKVVAYEGENSLESNLFNILVSSGALDIKTSRSQIKVGEKVKWRKNVTLEIAENVSVDLPGSAENISVKKVLNEEEIDAGVSVGITGRVISGKVSAELDLGSEGALVRLWRKVFGGITGNVIQETEEPVIEEVVEVILEDDATDYIIEYETEAPQSFIQSDTRIIISGPDELEYTDVLSFMDVPEVLEVGQEDVLRVYWIEGEQYVSNDPYDLDANGLLDYVEWVTPHLSNQTFDLILTDLNSTNATTNNITFEGHDSEQFIRLTNELIWSSTQSGYGLSTGSLVGYWTFDKDNSTTSFDYSEGNNDGILTGNAVSNESLCLTDYGGCLHLDGTNDYSSLPNNFVDPNVANNFTISSWFKSSSGTAQHIISFGSAGAAGNSYLGVDASGNLVSNLEDTGGTTSSISTSGTDYTDGAWHHAALTFFNGNSTIYVNGVSVGSEYSEEITGELYDNGVRRLGADGANGNDWNGQLDDVMVFNTTLNRTIIKEIYDNQSARFLSPGVVESKQFEIQVGRDSIELDLQDYEREHGSNISVRLGEWDVSLDYNVSDMDGSPTDGLVAYWNFDNRSSLGENQTLVVDRANGLARNNGTAIGNAQPNVTDGVYDGSYSFDGTGDYVDFGEDQSLKITSSLTISAWVNPDEIVDALEPVVTRWCDTSAGQASYLLDLRTTGALFAISSTGSNADNVRTGSAIPTGEWSHLVGTFDGDILRIYLNGVESNSTDTALTSIYDSTETVHVGSLLGNGADSECNSGGANYFLKGSVDEAMVFNRSLSDSEVRELYVKGRALWSYSDYQNLSAIDANDNSSRNTFNVSTVTSNLLPSFALYSDVNKFYSPILKATVSFLGTINIEDRLAPNVTYQGDTPADSATVTYDSLVVNVSSQDFDDHYTLVDFDNSLVGYWRMDDLNSTGDVVDISSYAGSNGSLVGTANINGTSGRFGNGTYFDGNSDYIWVNDFPKATTKITGTAWVYADSRTTWGTIMKNWGSASNIGLFHFGLESTTGELSLYIQEGDGNQVGPTKDTVAFPTGSWQFVSFVANGTDIMVYINGTQVGIPVAYDGTLSADLACMGIGVKPNDACTAPDSGYWDGLIDEVTLFNRSLSDAEIGALYNATANQYYNNFTSLAEGSHNFKTYSVDLAGNLNDTESRSVTYEIPDTTAPNVTYQGDTPTDSSTITYDSIVVNVSSADDFDEHYTLVDFDTSLVGYWRMDDTNSTLDSTDISTYSNNGSLVGTATINGTSGYWGNGSWFDGDSDYIDLQDSPSLNLTTPLTISVWGKTSSSIDVTATWGMAIVGRGEYGDPRNTMDLRVRATGDTAIFGYEYGSGSNSNYAIGTTDIADGTWHHLVGQWNGTDCVVYVDGSEEGDAACPNSPGPFDEAFSIGKDIGNSFGQDFFDGQLDEVMIFNRSLSPGEISSIYNATANQYYNNFTSLSDGSHSFTTYSVDLAGNLNDTESRSVTVDTSSDTCTYSSGDWTVDAADNCTITDVVDLGGNDFSVTGKGTFVLDGGNVTNFVSGVIRGNAIGDVQVRLLNGGRFVTNLMLGLIGRFSDLLIVAGGAMVLNMISFSRWRLKEGDK